MRRMDEKPCQKITPHHSRATIAGDCILSITISPINRYIFDTKNVVPPPLLFILSIPIQNANRRCLLPCVHCLCVTTVVQTLAHNSTATLSVIKDYLIHKLQRESQQIEDDERKISQYRQETAHLRAETQELRSRSVTVVMIG